MKKICVNVPILSKDDFTGVQENTAKLKTGKERNRERNLSVFVREGKENTYDQNHLFYTEESFAFLIVSKNFLQIY